MKVRDYFVLARSLPPRWLIQKGIKRIGKRIREYFRKKRDFISSTYVFAIPYKIGKLYSYFGLPSLCCLEVEAEELAGVTQYYLKHCFNLLGSGWVQVKHGMTCGGIEGHRYQMGIRIHADGSGHWLKGRVNPSNLKSSQRIWRLIDADYVPIDWHLDYKSGYRWSEDTWYLSVPYGHKPGVDIKVPWELARMQHLPHLAWAHILSKNGEEGFQPSEVYVREFRNQILDFIATNPPRFGVNWRSTMDVAIRISNWLVSYDLFRASRTIFDDSFETTFCQSVYEHGHHIVTNLEWDERLRGNHYLSNIVGLLFVASYLPCSRETDAWLAFCVQELVKEVGRQFNKDGSNFEASTSYHRLSAEMVVYATAVILGLSDEKRIALQEYDYRLFKYSPGLRPCPIPLYSSAGRERFTPFPIWYIEKLEKMAEFTTHLTKPNGYIPQIGDNDSGRFLKLQPLFRLMRVDEAGDQIINANGSMTLRDVGHYGDEDDLDHRHLVAAINGFFGRKDLTEFTGSGWIETEIVKQVAKGILLPSYADSEEPVGAEREFIHESEESGRIGRVEALESTGKGFSKKDEHLDGNKLYAYVEFGMFIFKSKDTYLAIRCGPNGQNGNGGHAHNDSLSFELNIRGRDFITDGGSYLYTPFPNIRNAFRSTKSHNTLVLDDLEQNAWADGLIGLFSMRNQARARILKLGIQYLMGEHHGFGTTHRREFKIDSSSMVFEDILESNHPSEIILNLAPEVEVVCLEEHASEEFYLEMSNTGLHVKAFLKWFERIEIVDGYFSRGYGKRLKNHLVRCRRAKPRTMVEIVS